MLALMSLYGVSFDPINQIYKRSKRTIQCLINKRNHVSRMTR